ncbi:uncharacterized protein LOC135390568 [Ornithodoros turicata]|uniref:uncharacterized protein LOC135390568 n=1 Tax=Ornithodoros turicata TaxID=34597 RepID=UPI00313A1D70
MFVLAAWLILATVSIPVHSLDPKVLREIILNFDPKSLTASCRKVFHKCKTKVIPMLMYADELLKNMDKFLAVECVGKELAKGFPRFDIECKMEGDFAEGIACIRDPKILEIVGPEIIKAGDPAMRCAIEAAS